jgi:hypothetical protein
LLRFSIEFNRTCQRRTGPLASIDGRLRRSAAPLAVTMTASLISLKRSRSAGNSRLLRKNADWHRGSAVFRSAKIRPAQRWGCGLAKERGAPFAKAGNPQRT